MAKTFRRYLSGIIDPERNPFPTFPQQRHARQPGAGRRTCAADHVPSLLPSFSAEALHG